jgi:hypothetical protein
MPARSKKSKVAQLNAAEIAAVAKAKPYVQRFIEDETLRENARAGIDSGRSAYGRLAHRKAPQKALLEDKKLQRDIRDAAASLRDVTIALNEAPKKKKKRRLGRRLLIVFVGAGVALAASEKLRSKVLDALFGAEEEFEYTPPPPPTSSQPATPVSAA